MKVVWVEIILTWSFSLRACAAACLTALNCCEAALSAIFFSQEVDSSGLRRLPARSPASFQPRPDACRATRVPCSKCPTEELFCCIASGSGSSL